MAELHGSGVQPFNQRLRAARRKPCPSTRPFFHETIYELERSGLGGADLVGGMGLTGWIEVRSPGKQIAAEGKDADGGDHRGPGGEE